MALRNIVLDGDPILRKKCKPVEEVNNKIRQILDDMAETMYDSENGAGLAASQVGILKRLVVIDMGSGLLKLVNPEIISEEGSQEVIEGCLSFPGQYGKLIRPKKVRVKALNEDGEPITLEGEGDMAKCFCHEIDHLNGVVFVDKVTEWIHA
ncbi:MAG: peptide deformylase [Anaerovorax sp.]|nr:peptide deformylase [Anaerovorax sp.]